MGTDDTASSEMEFSDPKVCRSFLCGGCPNDLVENTVRLACLPPFPLLPTAGPRAGPARVR